jgi:hypothetical protein
VSDDEARRYYDSHKTEFQCSNGHLRGKWPSPGDGTTLNVLAATKARAKAEDIRKRALAGALKARRRSVRRAVEGQRGIDWTAQSQRCRRTSRLSWRR